MDLGFDGERILRERMDLGIRVHLFNLGEIKNLVMDKIMDKIWLMINFGCGYGYGYLNKKLIGLVIKPKYK
jgi:hypothetical protein